MPRAALLAFAICLPGAARAQAPDAPAPAPPAAKKDGGAYRPDVHNMQELRLRGLMTSFGVAELDTQDAVLAFIVQEEKARQPLRQRSRSLYGAIRNNTEPEVGIRTMIEEFKASVEADKTRHSTAESALDNRIGYSKNPRLEGMLLLLGIIGDGPLLMPYGQPPKPKNPAPKVAADAQAAETPEDDRLLRDLRTVLVKRYDKNKNGEMEEEERQGVMQELQRVAAAFGLRVDQIQASQTATPVPANHPPGPTENELEEALQAREDAANLHE